MAAFTASRGRVAAVSDEQILNAYRWLADNEGVFCEPATRRLGRRPPRPRPAGRRGRRPSGDRRLRPHRPRPQGPRHRARQSARGDQLRQRSQRRRARCLRLGDPAVTARHRLVRVPASSANLGPGYDAMAAAMALHLELEVEEAGEFSFDPGGLDVSTGRDNLIVRAFESLRPADGIAFRLRSEIPLARGLGSSAAAIVAGLFAADHLYELALSKEEMLARATEIEGHPDNVAAAIYGGFVVCGNGGGRPDRGALRPARGAGGDRRDPARGGLDRASARGDPGRGAARRRGRQRLRRRDAGPRPAQRRPRPARPRPARQHPPGPPPRALPALDGDRRLGPRAGGAGGDDLRRRPDRAGLDDLAGRRQRRRGAGGALRRLGRGASGCRSAPSAPTSPSSELDGLGGADRAGRAGPRGPAGLGDGGPQRAARVAAADRRSSPRSGSARSTSTT